MIILIVQYSMQVTNIVARCLFVLHELTKRFLGILAGWKDIATKCGMSVLILTIFLGIISSSIVCTSRTDIGYFIARDF